MLFTKDVELKFYGSLEEVVKSMCECSTDDNVDYKSIEYLDRNVYQGKMNKRVITFPWIRYIGSLEDTCSVFYEKLKQRGSQLLCRIRTDILAYFEKERKSE